MGRLETVEPSSVMNPATVASVGHEQNTDIPPVKEQILSNVVEHNEHLDGSQKEKLYLLILSYHVYFAQDETDFGHTNRLKHAIDTGDSAPIQQSHCRIAPAKKEGNTEAPG